MKRTYYFAGGLFDHKELSGNVGLASAVARISGGEWEAVLPQNHQDMNATPVGIRNSDLRLLMNSDAILVNFDGTDLDSGTVVEFCFAKALDIPAVILRTDFRHCGDAGRNGDPWNLMCSGYPRTKNVLVNGMELYTKHCASIGADLACGRDLMEAYWEEIGGRVVGALEQVCSMKPWLSREDAEQHCCRMVKSTGSLSDIVSCDEIKNIVNRKIEKGIY